MLLLPALSYQATHDRWSILDPSGTPDAQTGAEVDPERARVARLHEQQVRHAAHGRQSCERTELKRPWCKIQFKCTKDVQISADAMSESGENGLSKWGGSVAGAR